MTVGTCPICLTTAELTREHVWPNWFLQRMDEQGVPPLGWSLNGQPLLDRGNNQIRGDKRQRIMIPVCDHCNAEMNRRIEVPAKSVIEQLALNAWRGRYKREEWRAFGVWWAKVLLLIGHDESFLENARLNKLVNLNFETRPDLRWLTDGSPVPDHVSVFVYNADFTRTGTEHELVLPARVMFDDKTSAACHMLSLATPGLGVAAVSHPGVVVRNPLVKGGRAWEVLHDPPRRGDIGRLKPVQRDAVRFLRGGGVPEGHVVDDSESSWLTGLFDYEAGRLPVPSRVQVLKAHAKKILPWC